MTQRDVRRRELLVWAAAGTGLLPMVGCGGGESAEGDAPALSRVGDPIEISAYVWPPKGFESDAQGGLWIAHGADTTTVTQINAQGERLADLKSDASLVYSRFAVTGQTPLLARAQVSSTTPALHGFNSMRVDAWRDSAWVTELEFYVVESLSDQAHALPSGGGHLLWTNVPGQNGSTSIYATRREADGTWRAPQVLHTRAPGEGALYFSEQCLAEDDSNGALLVWMDVRPADAAGSLSVKLMASHGSALTGEWSPAEAVRTWDSVGVVTGYELLPRVVHLGGDQWMIVGSDWMSVTKPSTLWAKAWRDGAWELGETRIDVPIDALTGATYGFISDFLLRRLGSELLVAWVAHAVNTSSVFIARGHVSGAWEEPRVVSPDVGPYASLFGLDVGSDGRAALGWNTNGDRNAMVAVRDASDRWASAELYPDTPSGGGFSLRARPDDTWAVLAQRPVGSAGLPRLVVQHIR